MPAVHAVTCFASHELQLSCFQVASTAVSITKKPVPAIVARYTYGLMWSWQSIEDLRQLTK